MKTQIRRRILRRLIWVYIVCWCPSIRILRVKNVHCCLDCSFIIDSTTCGSTCPLCYAWSLYHTLNQRKRIQVSILIWSEPLFQIGVSVKESQKEKQNGKQGRSWWDGSFWAVSWGSILFITKTYLYNFDPLKPHFYIVELGFTGVYIVFLISAQKHRLWLLVRTASVRRF